jgi:hypothetical protein
LLQYEEPEEEYSPPAQGAHVIPSVEYRPAAQGVQMLLARSLILPTEHTLHAKEPPALTPFKGHCVHEASPPVENVSAGHGSSSVRSAVGLNPATAELQKKADEDENLPAGHGTQKTPLEEYFPAEQAAQLLSAAFFTLPASHAVHTEAPGRL